jgi:hypothetical protein
MSAIELPTEQVVGALATHYLRELDSRHIGHGLIRHHEVDRLPRLENLQCVLFQIGLDYSVSKVLQHTDGAHGDERIVVDHQNGRWATRCDLQTTAGSLTGDDLVAIGNHNVAVVPFPTSPRTTA